VQLDGGTLRVEPESGLALLVGGDAVVGDELADDGTALPSWTVIPTLAPLPGPVQTLQTDVWTVTSARNGEPECIIEQEKRLGDLPCPATRSY